MRQKSLQAKLQQSVSLVIVITLLASYMMAIFLVYNQTSASMREEIEKEADYLAAAVSITGEEHLEDLDTAFPDTRITLIDREGTVIYDTDQYEITFVNHLDRPEVVSAAGKGRGSDVRRSDSLGEEMYYYAILLEDGNILRISRAADTAREISRLCSIPMRTDERLTEQCFGCYEGTARDGQEFHEAKKRFADRYENGESMLQTAHRVYGLLDEITSQEDTVYILVAHNGLARIIQSYFTSMTNEEFASFGIPNCAVMRFDY